MRNLLSSLAVVLATLTTSSCVTDRVGMLDPSAADPVLPIVVEGYLVYLEADATMGVEAKADRRMAAEALRRWWQAGIDEQAAAKGGAR